LFFKPLQNEFGWSRSALAGVQSTARVIEAVVAPIVGPVIDRYGPRVLMPIGAVIVGLTMLGVTQVHAIWQFYLFRGIITAVGFTLMGALVSDVAINNWFIRKRGRALAISRVGGNLSNIIMVPVCVFVIAASGWRTMFVIFAVVTWITVLIPSAIVMRRRPEDMGLRPDGINNRRIDNNGQVQETIDEETDSQPEPIWTRREVLATRTFWLLAACFAINSMAFQGINISIAPYVQDMGYHTATLAAILTYRAIIGAAGALVMGFLAERADRAAIRSAPFMILAIGSICFLMGKQPIFLWLAITCHSLGAAGVNITQEVVWANYYGRLSLGSVRSLSYFVSFGLGAIGPIAMNAVFDFLGSYQPAFLAMVGFFTVSAVLMSIARPVKAKRYAVINDRNDTVES